jgi:ribosomal protein L20A (L18A)
MNQEEPETGTLERHYRVTLDFKMLVREITPEVCQESFYFSDKDKGEDEAGFKEQIERQQRLYKLLREDRQALEQYLLSVLAQDTARYTNDRLASAFKIKKEEDVLAPLCQRMSQEDAKFFEECREMGVLEANMELISAAFKVEWMRAEIAEMKNVMEGDLKRAEVIEETTISLIRKINSP